MDSPKWPGYTAYHFATKYKAVAAIHTLSKSKLRGQSKKKDKNGQTPRDLACNSLVGYSVMAHVMSEPSDIFQSVRKKTLYYQSQGDMPKCESVNQPSAFHLACMRNDSYLVKTFLECGAPVNIPVSEKYSLCPLYSPLHFAVESRCKENVKLLLKYRAALSWTNAYKMTALHLAMYNEKEGYTSDVTNLLYSTVKNIKSNKTDENGLSYFHIAVSKNDLNQVIGMLNKKKADVNSQVSTNHRGFSLYTPLHFAVQYNHKSMAKLLIKRGADINAVSSRGTPLQMSFERRPVSNVFDMFELFLKHRARADLTVGKKTLLHMIVAQVIVCESEKRDPTNVHEAGTTLLLSYIEWVIKLGCDVNAQDENGDTALHLASCHSNSCVRRLLRNGADINIENDKGECAALFRCRPTKPEEATMYHHLQNLKTLGLKTNPKIEKDCDSQMEEWIVSGCYENEDDDENDKEYEYYGVDVDEEVDRDGCLERIHKKRLKEIKKMKKVMLDGKTSLYDFMRMDGKEAGAYAENEVLKNIFEDENQRYFVYGYLIKLQYRSSRENARRISESEDVAETRSKRRRVK